MSNEVCYQHSDETICIVGRGCVLPGSNNVDSFWENTLSGNCMLGSVPRERWDLTSHLSANRKLSDKTYSGLGGFVAQKTIGELAIELGVNQTTHNRLMVMTLEACRQALADAKYTDTDTKPLIVDTYLGCMGIDESGNFKLFQRELQQTIRRLKEHQPQGWEDAIESITSYLANDMPGSEAANVPEDETFLTSSIIQQIGTRFKVKGEGALIDAACASSLAAIDYSIERLKQKKCDFAITGGIEGDLSPSTFVLFSSVGALAQDCCAPFDNKSQGLAQGEGAVVFVLQRLSDALVQNRTIYGLLTGSGASSDGSSSSLFSPTVSGQKRAFKQAYQQAGFKTPNYIECHGTGTQVGDRTELTSLREFFRDKALTIGSVKSLIGHTKGAAGAAGLLKNLMAMKHRKIPPSRYFTNFICPADNIQMNTEMLSLDSLKSPLRFGISSFGFGNINYHLILDEFNDSVQENISTLKPQLTLCSREGNKTNHNGNNKIVVLSEVDVGDIDIETYLAHAPVNILPKSMPQTDDLQLQAVIAALESFRFAGLPIAQINKEKVSVISASCLCLPKAIDFGSRVNYDDLLASISNISKASREFIRQRKERFVEITEDIGPGILNNVIAGRVCNCFDFKGKSMNIDADFTSLPVALSLAKMELETGKSDYVLVLYSDERFNAEIGIVERGRFSGLLLSTESQAQDHAIPIKMIMDNIQGVGYGD